MRTAIFVYQSTQIDIKTNETGLELCGLTAAAVALSEGASTATVAPGMYKIDSCQEVDVTGDDNVEIIVAHTKTGGPTLPTFRASAAFAPLDNQAVDAFFAVPDAKWANP
jgi:hypothetical protein